MLTAGAGWSAWLSCWLLLGCLKVLGNRRGHSKGAVHAVEMGREQVRRAVPPRRQPVINTMVKGRVK